MIEDIAEGKEKHRINKKHKVKDFLFFFSFFFFGRSEIPFRKGIFSLEMI